MRAGGLGARAWGRGLSAALCAMSALVRHVPSCGGAARFMRPFASAWSVGAASLFREHVLFELCMLMCATLRDAIGERSAGVVNVFRNLFERNVDLKCEYGTDVV